MANLFKINLANPSSIQTAITKVAKMIDRTTELQNKIVYRTTEQLLKTIKFNFVLEVGSPDEMTSTGLAYESLHAVYTQTGNGLLIGQIMGMDYIVYIEFGTGDKGASMGSPNTTAGWSNDGKSWVYYDDAYEQFFTTTGMAPRPFLRKSIEECRMNMSEGVSVAFSEWIALM